MYVPNLLFIISLSFNESPQLFTIITSDFFNFGEKEIYPQLHAVLCTSLDAVKGHTLALKCNNDDAADANEGRRPMLYVNLSHSWFHDPKNWDDRKGIFDV